jgi:hypothetical protein
VIAEAAAAFLAELLPLFSPRWAYPMLALTLIMVCLALYVASR